MIKVRVFVENLKNDENPNYHVLVALAVRVVVMIGGAYMLAEMTNPSVIYHGMRGQGLFKLYMIKAVNEIVGLLLVGYGQGMTDNFARAMFSDNERRVQGLRSRFSKTLLQNPIQDKIFASIGLLIYGVIHAFFMCLEMFTLHVALTSSSEGILSFMFYNNFAEVKITVFKKTDAAGLFGTASNDSVERLNLLLYMSNIFLTTSQKK